MGCSPNPSPSRSGESTTGSEGSSRLCRWHNLIVSLKDIMRSLRTRPGEDRNADPGGNFTYSTPISSFPARKGFIPQCCVLTSFRCCLHGRMALVGIAVGPWASDSPHANRTSQPISLGVSLSLSRYAPSAVSGSRDKKVSSQPSSQNAEEHSLATARMGVGICSLGCLWLSGCVRAVSGRSIVQLLCSGSLIVPVSHIPSPIVHPGISLYLSVSLCIPT